MSAYVMKIKPRGVDALADALENNQLILANAENLLGESDWYKFREIVRKKNYPNDENYRGASQNASAPWLFIHDMKKDDLVVVPGNEKDFYVARIADNNVVVKEGDEGVYLRSVKWLNGKNAMPKSYAKATLRRKMKYFGTCCDASAALSDIEECLKSSESGGEPDFWAQERKSHIESLLNAMRRGGVDDRDMEEIVRRFFEKMGGRDSKIIPRNQDAGVDVVADFNVAGVDIRVGAQVKHHDPEPPIGIDVIDKLIEGMASVEANLGMVITTGTFSPEAEIHARKHTEENATLIELMDGERFVELIVDNGWEKIF